MQEKIKNRIHQGPNPIKLVRFMLAFSWIQLVIVLTLLFTGDLAVTSMELFFAAIGGVGAVISIQAALTLLRAYTAAQSSQQVISDLESYNRTLRAQRHDFKNHMQVISALLDMEEYQEAAQYIRKVNTDLQYVGRANRTSQPAVNALLQAKLVLCEKKGISFEVDVKSMLQLLPVTSWELCRVLGNLIDNAIDALESAHVEKPFVKIILEDTDDRTRIRVINNGPEIPTDLRHRIFAPAFSTKGEGRGMGLAIVTSLVQGCGGSVRLFSKPGETCFEVLLPFSNRAAEQEKTD
jgi:two-component system sensor histidine kinase AgrC